MDIKLPINPRVRQAIEKEMATPTVVIVKDLIGSEGNKRQATSLPLIDGLYQDRAFMPLVGAAFILNYLRFSEGLLTEDQADKLLHDALMGLRLAHLKVIHPQLDIDGMIQHLVRDRLEKTADQKLKDLCARKANLVGYVSTGMSPVSFELAKHHLVEEAVKEAPMAIALGMPKEAALKHVAGFIDGVLTSLNLTDERCPHIRMGFLHHFLIAYPDLWNKSNVEPYHFLGEPMICMSPVRGMGVDKAVAHGQAGKSLIRHPGGMIPRELIEFTLDYLADIDTDVLNARHLLREGTRSAAWMDRCTNLEEGLPILERLLAYGVVHPALGRIEGVVAKLSEAGKRAALLCYANGGELPAEMAQAIVDTAPQVYDQVLDQVKKFTAIHRLADLKWPSDEQLLKLSPKNKRLLLEEDLGI